MIAAATLGPVRLIDLTCEPLDQMMTVARRYPRSILPSPC